MEKILITKLNEIPLEIKYSKGVYKIYHENCPNDIYVGSSSSNKKLRGFAHRFIRHRRLLLNNRHYNKPLQNIVNNYGLEGIIFEIIEFCSENIVQREQYWLDKLSPSLNTRKKAQVNVCVHSEEYIQSISKAVDCYDLKGNYLKSFMNSTLASYETGVHKSCIVQACQNKKKGNTKAGNFQWKYSDENHIFNEYVKNTKYKIICYNSEGQFVKIFDSILEASLELNINTGNLSRAVANKNNIICYNHIFRKYSENFPKNIIPKTNHKNQMQVKIIDLKTNEEVLYKSFRQVPSGIISRSKLTLLVAKQEFITNHRNLFKIHIIPYN